jgi:hypothetical protein
MRQLELARLFLRKAGEDEALLDAVAQLNSVADVTFGFHCQQAAEKLLKALCQLWKFAFVEPTTSRN